MHLNRPKAWSCAGTAANPQERHHAVWKMKCPSIMWGKQTHAEAKVPQTGVHPKGPDSISSRSLLQQLQAQTVLQGPATCTASVCDWEASAEPTSHPDNASAHPGWHSGEDTCSQAVPRPFHWTRHYPGKLRDEAEARNPGFCTVHSPQCPYPPTQESFRLTYQDGVTCSHLVSGDTHTMVVMPKKSGSAHIYVNFRPMNEHVYPRLMKLLHSLLVPKCSVSWTPIANFCRLP